MTQMFKKGFLALLLAFVMVFATACSNNNENKDNETKNDVSTTEDTQNETENKEENKEEEQPAEENNEAENTEAGKKVVTVTTSFLEDMVHQLAGDLVDVQLIIPAGEDPHLYVAKPEDLDKIENCDLLLYHGLHFEGKMVSVLEKKGHEVTKEFPKDQLLTMDEDGVTITDPHFWFDINLYKMATQEAAKQLEELLPENKDTISENLTKYLGELDALDADNREKLSQIPEESRYLVTPHDAFSYFSRLYDVHVVAPQGVSTDSEVASKDIDTTVNLIVEKKIKAIFAESTTSPERMKKLQENCKAKGWDVKVLSGEGFELYSDSLAPKGNPGDNYIDMYKNNVKLMYENLK